MTDITRRTALKTSLGGALAVTAAAVMAKSAFAADPVEIDLFFPVPVQGMLANKMKELIDRFNGSRAPSGRLRSIPAAMTTPTSRPAPRSRPGSRRRQ